MSKDKKSSSRVRRDFFFSIMPKSGFYCVMMMKGKSVHNNWFETKEDCIEFIESVRRKKNMQVFVAQATFRERGDKKSGRKQEKAAYLKCFFLDIDCGKGKDYPTQDAAKKALKAFCRDTGLPYPAVVNSGNGLYAYWPLKKSLKANEWQSEAKQFQKVVLAKAPGLDQDRIMADSARMLRPVGSFNRKDAKSPKRVTLQNKCEPIEIKDFKMCITAAIASLSVEAGSQAMAPEKQQAPIEDQVSNAAKIAERCPVIGLIRKTKGNVTEPLWHAAIGVLRHCEDANAIIHKWSKGHPNYSRVETEAKIAQHQKPPTKCLSFAKLCPKKCKKCEHFGKIKSPIKLGNMRIPDFVKELNSDHFVSRYGRKTVVCRESYNEVLNRKELEVSTFQDFKNYYINRKAKIKSKGKFRLTPLGTAWLEHPQRRQYKGIVMSPQRPIEEHYNLWRGYAVKAIEGSWKLMKKHIFKVICNSDKQLYEYVMGWLAQMIQKPWAQGEVALVLQGGKGTGKGMLGTALCRIIGQHACYVTNAKHVTGNFNAHLEDCIFLFADEAFCTGDRQAENVLKGLITEPVIPIERKNVDLKMVRNMLHVFMASNNDWVVPAGMDERRYCVLKVSDSHAQDHEYFAALVQEMNNGGLEAMLFDLQKLNITNFNVREVPMTAGLVEQKIQSLDPLMSWWYQKLVDGELLPGHNWGTVPVMSLYEDYISHAQRQGSNRRANETEFGMQLRKVLPSDLVKVKRRIGGEHSKRVNHYQFPELKACRKQFTKKLGNVDLTWA